MKTIRQVIQVGKSRQIQITLPESVEPGLVEVVIVVQPVLNQTKSTSGCSQENQIVELFGFLPPRIEPLQFQQELRKEWDRY
ncbi:MAG TPA: hypothetical protein DCE56_11710 [Cyanobacteria bacterium UBA8553]|nr:hypothetical protein [Cyanobacteria bacterium UBA8553]HAJ63446.1 hypothetical protein [Cyanobacteria bacterium UBA8543]